MNATLSLATAMAATITAATMAIPSAAMATSVKPPGSFATANIPGSITKKSGTRDTIAGDIFHTTMAGHAGDAQLSITATTLPGFVTAVTSDSSLLRKAKRELLDDYDGSEASWGRCTFKDAACRTLTYLTSSGRNGEAQLMLKGNALVVLNAVYDKDAAAARAFLSSAS